MTQPPADPADDEPSATPLAESVPDVLDEVLSPTAAGHPDDSAAVVDFAQISPAPGGFSPASYAVACVAGSLATAVLTIWVARQGTAIPGIDRRIHAWVIEHRTPDSAVFARAVTWGGVTTVVLPALLVVGAVAGRYGKDLRRRLGAGLLLSGVASAGVFVGLRINAFVGRQRPPFADWAGTAGGPAFPSGHTTAATLFAGFCAWALAARVQPGWPRRAIRVGAVGYAAAVGWSRIWLGVHWPTDVVGGWLYGLTWSAGSAAVILTLRRRSAGRRAAKA